LGYPPGDTTAQYKTVYTLANLFLTEVVAGSNLDPETRYPGDSWFFRPSIKNPG